MDIHPGRNVYLTSWFILSVLFLTDHETSVVPTSVRDPPSQGLHNSTNIYLTSWVISVCVVFDRLRDICGPYTCPGSPIIWTSTLVETST